MLTVLQVRGLKRLVPSSLGLEEVGQGVKFMQNSRLHSVVR